MRGLREAGVTHVLNLAAKASCTAEGRVSITDGVSEGTHTIDRLTIDAEDEEEFPLIDMHLSQCASFLNECRAAGGKALVHCSESA